MNAVKIDLLGAVKELRHALGRNGGTDPHDWTHAVHEALGVVAAAVHDELRGEERTVKNMGDINPDFQNIPGTQRQLETSRQRLVRLGEQVHQLRAEMRQTTPLPPLDIVQLRLRGEEIANAIDKVRQDDDKFLLDTVNSNPGAGE